MKLSKKAERWIGCLWLIANAVLIITQIVWLTMKITGTTDRGWLAVLSPSICIVGLPLAFIVISVIALAPKAVMEERQRRKRVEAEAKKYGMERKPGESVGDLKRRIIQRNMITGDYSRKDIKDEILKAFPNVGSCQILVNNQTDEIVLIPRRSDSEELTDAELREIVEFAALYIPMKYKVTIKRAKEEPYDTTEK